SLAPDKARGTTAPFVGAASAASSCGGAGNEGNGERRVDPAGRPAGQQAARSGKVLLPTQGPTLVPGSRQTTPRPQRPVIKGPWSKACGQGPVIPSAARDLFCSPSRSLAALGMTIGNAACSLTCAALVTDSPHSPHSFHIKL